MKRRNLAHVRDRLDTRLAGLQPLGSFEPPAEGWIRVVRDAIGMTGAQLGRRMGATAQAIVSIERSEAAGRIQIDTLRRAAAAMDCAIVYALVPKDSLRELVRRRARERALAAIQNDLETGASGDRRIDGDLDGQIDDYIETKLRDRDLWED